MFGLKGYFISGIIVSAMLGGITILCYRYVQLQASFSIAQQQLKLQQHRRIAIEQETVRAEEELYKNHGIQRQAIQDLLKNGHLNGDANPEWMREYQTPRS